MSFTPLLLLCACYLPFRHITPPHCKRNHGTELNLYTVNNVRSFTAVNRLNFTKHDMALFIVLAITHTHLHCPVLRHHCKPYSTIKRTRSIAHEMKKPKKYASEKELEDEDWDVQLEWKEDRDDYRKYSRIITKHLSQCYSVLWGQCNLPLQNKIKNDREFASMTTGDVKMLYKIIQNICHGSDHNDNCFMAAMESVYNFHLIRGDDYSDLSSYFEAFEKRYDVVEKTGWTFATEAVRDLYISELENKNMQNSSSYKILKLWSTTMATTDEIKLGQGILNDRYKAYVFLKRAGFRFENFRIDLKNDFDAGTDKYPDDIVESCRRLENWRPMYIPKVRNDLKSSNFHQGADTDLTGEQHYENSSGKNGDNKGLSCFRCDRVGHLTRSCTYDK